MTADLELLGPELALVFSIVVLLLGDLLWKRHPERVARLTWTAVGGIFVAGVLLLALTAESDRLALGMFAADGFSRFFRGLFLTAALAAVVFAALSDEIPVARIGEYLVVLFALCLGLCLLSGAQNLLLVYLAIELVSVPSYVLAGFRRGDRRSSEAALKYVIYGGVASGLMLYGFSWLYGLYGTLDVPMLATQVAAGQGGDGAFGFIVAMAGLCSLAGFAYKVAAVPFHMWCPDVYEGAPTPFVAFLSVAPKAAGFAALLRFLGVSLQNTPSSPLGDAFPWALVLGIVAVATMTLGNLVAIAQNNIKRLLAYSSIAHAGYLLMAVAVRTVEGTQAAMLYLGIYLLMNMGAFLAVMAVRKQTGSESLDDYRGLASRNPYLAATLAAFLFSLTGIPPFAGFIGKFYLFAAVVQTGKPFFYAIALIGVLNSAVSLYYYARVLKLMYLDKADADATALRIGPGYAGALTAFALPTLVLGVWWAPLADMAAQATALLR
jgi:NADH-quinone oxidoreductase subunit N